MKRPIPPAVFYITIAVAFFIAIVILYRQATDPLYHRDPDDQQFIPPSLRQRPPAGQTPGGPTAPGRPANPGATGR